MTAPTGFRTEALLARLEAAYAERHGPGRVVVRRPPEGQRIFTVEFLTVGLVQRISPKNLEREVLAAERQALRTRRARQAKSAKAEGSLLMGGVP